VERRHRDGLDARQTARVTTRELAPMAVARVTEISATSTKSFEDAVKQGLDRATKTLRNVKSAWIKEHRVSLENDKVAEFQVNMQITFILEN
jgi:flavin-binding protein dodecin